MILGLLGRAYFALCLVPQAIVPETSPYDDLELYVIQCHSPFLQVDVDELRLPSLASSPIAGYLYSSYRFSSTSHLAMGTLRHMSLFLFKNVENQKCETPHWGVSYFSPGNTLSSKAIQQTTRAGITSSILVLAQVGKFHFSIMLPCRWFSTVYDLHKFEIPVPFSFASHLLLMNPPPW